MKTPNDAAKAAPRPDSTPDNAAARERAAATTEAMADGGGIGSELQWLRWHLDGIELALLAGEHTPHHPPPRAVVALVQSAQDRVTGLIRAAEKANV
ncbi:hypothetical protein [Xanthobacter autotrophicus]|uniref:hypothetical protein n=1 Tax=Xanthobacter autotrophicus TaxID=280 RepID=UPI00372AEE16